MDADASKLGVVAVAVTLFIAVWKFGASQAKLIGERVRKQALRQHDEELEQKAQIADEKRARRYRMIVRQLRREAIKHGWEIQ